MDNLLYLPVSSLNFNSMFATESISPHAFYLERRFGYKRNAKNKLQPNDNVIFAFNRPILFQTAETDYEEYPILISVSHDLLKPLIVKKIPTKEVEISIFADTIYFDTVNFKFIFPSLDIKQIVLSKSLSSFETKTVSKYSQSFTVLETNKNTLLEYDLPNFESEVTINNMVLKDEIFDSLKGLFYGLMIGHFFCKPWGLLEIQQTLSQILNDFGGFKSEIELSSVKRESSKGKTAWGKRASLSIRGRTDKYDTLRSRIEYLKELVEKFFGVFEKQEAIKNYLTSLGFDYEAHKALILKLELVDFILKKYQETNRQPQFLVRELQNILSQYVINESNAYQKEKINSLFKDKISEVIYFIDRAFEPVINDEKLETIKSIGAELPHFGFFSFFQQQNIGESDFKMFQLVCGILHNNRKLHKGDTPIETKNDLLRLVGDAIRTEFGVNSKERSILLQFYNLQNNKAHDFDITTVRSYSLVAFISFLINIDSAEKLEEFIVSRGIKHRFIPFSFFGVYVGFSGIGRTFTDKIFDPKYGSLHVTVDSVLLHRDINEDTTTYAPNELVLPALKEPKGRKTKTAGKKKTNSKSTANDDDVPNQVNLGL